MLHSPSQDKGTANAYDTRKTSMVQQFLRMCSFPGSCIPQSQINSPLMERSSSSITSFFGLPGSKGFLWELSISNGNISQDPQFEESSDYLIEYGGISSQLLSDNQVSYLAGRIWAELETKKIKFDPISVMRYPYVVVLVLQG